MFIGIVLDVKELLKRFQTKEYGNVYHIIYKDEEVDKWLPHLENQLNFPIKGYKIEKGPNPRLFLVKESKNDGKKLWSSGVMLELKDDNVNTYVFSEFAHIYPTNRLPLSLKYIRSQAPSFKIDVWHSEAPAVEGRVLLKVESPSHLHSALERVEEVKDQLVALTSLDRKGLESSVVHGARNVKDLLDRLSHIEIKRALVVGKEEEPSIDIDYVPISKELEEEMQRIARQEGLKNPQIRVVKIPWTNTIYAEAREKFGDHIRMVRIDSKGRLLRGIEVEGYDNIPSDVESIRLNRRLQIFSPVYPFEELLAKVRK